jgi:hypothetical protein
MLIMMFAGWVNEHQRTVIACLRVDPPSVECLTYSTDAEWVVRAHMTRWSQPQSG